MKIVERPVLSLVGVSTRTNNTNEIDVTTAKILPLWRHFYQDIYPEQLSGDVVYGVYSNYESDASGEFDVTVAVKAQEDENVQTGSMFDKIELAPGRYMVFSGQTGAGNPVFHLWQQVWQHFEQTGCPHQRCWITDYEIYYRDGKIELLIGIVN
nr:GyrI-like domain-containing protein [Pantoea sp. 201603H]